MSVFGSNNDRSWAPAVPERRPTAADFTYEASTQAQAAAQAQAQAAPRATPESARKASVLGKTLTFRGELWADEDLVLQGRVEGAIHHTQSLTVGVDGVVIGDIHAANITVEGTVEGNLHGSTSVLVGATAKVTGNIVTPRVGIREGAQFNGAVEMGNRQGAQRSVTPSAAGEQPLNDRAVERMLQR